MSLWREAFNIPGEYEWEYFTYRQSVNSNDSNPAASGLIRVVGLADQNNGAHYPPQLMLPNDFTLFNLKFLVLNNTPGGDFPSGSILLDGLRR